MRQPGDIVLISCYELGHQPLGLASAAGFLRRAGFQPSCVDLGVRPLDEEALAACARAQLVAISVPMHTALRLGIEVAKRLRARNYNKSLVFYGLYAPLNQAYLRGLGAEAFLDEDGLLALAGGGAAAPLPLRRPQFAAPDRSGLPPLDAYAKLVVHHGERTEKRLAGYVEATRGCRHLCRHCPIPSVYGGRFFAVPVPLVVDDALAQIAAGARHITFGDADFLNAPKHALAVARALHQAAPAVSFDITTKVEHIVRHAEVFPELAGLGCLFMVSAFESLSDRVLGILDKGHNAGEAQRAIAVAREAGISIRPTWLPFTPWTTLADYLEICRFLVANQLEPEVDPVQLSLRLLIPPGSLLLERTELQPHLGGLDAARFTYAWTHPDPRMDALCLEVQALVERAAGEYAGAEATFTAIYALAAVAAAEPAPRPRAGHRRPPHLSEPWFC